jgi:hypothetical protein
MGQLDSTCRAPPLEADRGGGGRGCKPLPPFMLDPPNPPSPARKPGASPSPGVALQVLNLKGKFSNRVFT